MLFIGDKKDSPISSWLLRFKKWEGPRASDREGENEYLVGRWSKEVPMTSSVWFQSLMSAWMFLNNLLSTLRCRRNGFTTSTGSTRCSTSTTSWRLQGYGSFTDYGILIDSLQESLADIKEWTMRVLREAEFEWSMDNRSSSLPYRNPFPSPFTYRSTILAWLEVFFSQL